MLVNLGKFHDVIFDKHNVNHTNQNKNIDQKKIKRYQMLNF